MNNGRISRVTFPTASFSLTTDMILWIAARAEAQKQSKSEIIRSLLADEMEREVRAVPIGTPTEEDNAA